MARSCPVCQTSARSEVWSMSYRVPDDWPLPSEITWYTCDSCGMLYGDGDFNQAMLDDFYQNYYGFGVNSKENTQRLIDNAIKLAETHDKREVIVDFGGAGDDGRSVLTDTLCEAGFANAVTVGVGDPLPACDVIFASHVIEHIYDVPETMERLCGALKQGGTLIVDGPDSTGLLLTWDMPMLDYNTKHVNHFTLRNYLDLGRYYGFEAVKVESYILGGGPSNKAAAWQIYFKRINIAKESAYHIAVNVDLMLDKLASYSMENIPVNIWGLGDLSWYILSMIRLNVVDYIDLDPAFRGRTYHGKPVLERPTNDLPILILCQGQRSRVIEYIEGLKLPNEIIQI